MSESPHQKIVNYLHFRMVWAFWTLLAGYGLQWLKVNHILTWYNVVLKWITWLLTSGNGKNIIYHQVKKTKRNKLNRDLGDSWTQGSQFSTKVILSGAISNLDGIKAPLSLRCSGEVVLVQWHHILWFRHPRKKFSRGPSGAKHAK